MWVQLWYSVLMSVHCCTQKHSCMYILFILYQLYQIPVGLLLLGTTTSYNSGLEWMYSTSEMLLVTVITVHNSSNSSASAHVLHYFTNWVFWEVRLRGFRQPCEPTFLLQEVDAIKMRLSVSGSSFSIHTAQVCPPFLVVHSFIISRKLMH